MVPPGGEDIMPDRHAVQLLIGRRDGDFLRAAAFQNTPAQLDGQPEALAALTEGLRAALSD
jgi:hypothetical protein